MFIFMIYHIQIDDNSKRTNQMMKIVLRFIIASYSNFDFVLILSILQIMFNNSLNVVIDFFNEIFYDFKIRDAFFVTLSNDETLSISNDFLIQRLKYQRETTNAIVFVNVKIKIYYDARHLFLLLNSEDHAYLRLHQKYQLFDKFNKKLFQQRCDSFLMKRRIKRFVYELNLSSI